VILHNGTNSYELVRQGWCWWNRNYPHIELESLEKEAQGAKNRLMNTRTLAMFLTGTVVGAGTALLFVPQV
jgi:hypothetical protein